MPHRLAAPPPSAFKMHPVDDDRAVVETAHLTVALRESLTELYVPNERDRAWIARVSELLAIELYRRGVVVVRLVPLLVVVETTERLLPCL